MPSPLEESLRNALKEFEKDLRGSGLAPADVRSKSYAAGLFVDFLFGASHRKGKKRSRKSLKDLRDRTQPN